MELRGKNILLVSPEPWDHIFVSKHHYAVHLGKMNNQIFFLNPPTGSNSVVKTDFENVNSVTYTGFPKGLRYYPRLLQRYFINRVFLKVQKLCNVEFDLIWSFDNSVFYDFSALPKKIIKISHIVDLNQDFQTKIAAETADYCFCTTELIKERLLKFNPKVFKINHGYNHIEINQRANLPGNSNVKVLYSGNLAMPFIDWLLLRDVVIRNPDLDFIFIGPNQDQVAPDTAQSDAKKEVANSSNAYFIGRIKSNELAAYYSAADIMLVCYQEKYHNDQANPHKMMEYLGSGKMIVATNSLEYIDLQRKELIRMSKNNSEFVYVFSEVRKDLGLWNSANKSEARKNFALDNSYSEQIKRIESCIVSFA